MCSVPRIGFSPPSAPSCNDSSNRCDGPFRFLVPPPIDRRKPSEVVPQHRRRAVVFWSFLMISITACEHLLLDVASVSEAFLDRPEIC